MCEKASEVTFLKPEMLQNDSNEGKGKEKRKERGKGKKKGEKAIVAPLICIIATLKIVLAEKNCSTQKV